MDLQMVAQALRLCAVVLILGVMLSQFRTQKIAWFLLGVYGLVTTLLTATTEEFSELHSALSIGGYLSGPVMACVCFGIAVWRAED